MTDLPALARAAADAVDADRVIALARDLVRIRSVVDTDAGTTEADAARFVADTLAAAGLDPIVEEVAPGRPNVICDWSGSGFTPERDRTLMFEGHTDVVTEGDPSAWAVPPFEGRIVDGRLVGRGSADMKAGVAAAIGATLAVRAVAPDLPGRIRLGIVVDEEGMMLGIKHFIASGWADDVDGAIVCEPEENELCLVQKGAMRVRIDVRGRMSHGAMPYAGVNPLRAVGRLLVGLERIEADEQARCGEHPHLGLPWITPTILRAPVRGEAQSNVAPEAASVNLDIRTVPAQDHEALMAAIRALAARVADEVLAESTAAEPRLDIAVDCFESRPSTETAPDDPLVRALQAAYRPVLGKPVRFGGVPGATDGTFLSAEAGVPIVTVGPGDREIPHQVDEFVRVDEMVASARLYAAAAIVYLGAIRD